MGHLAVLQVAFAKCGRGKALRLAQQPTPATGPHANTADQNCPAHGTPTVTRICPRKQPMPNSERSTLERTPRQHSQSRLPRALITTALFWMSRLSAQLPPMTSTAPARSATDSWLHDSWSHSSPCPCLEDSCATLAHDSNWSNDASTCPFLNRRLTSSAACSRTTEAGPRRETRSVYNSPFGFP